MIFITSLGLTYRWRTATSVIFSSMRTSTDAESSSGSEARASRILSMIMLVALELRPINWKGMLDVKEDSLMQ